MDSPQSQSLSPTFAKLDALSTAPSLLTQLPLNTESFTLSALNLFSKSAAIAPLSPASTKNLTSITNAAAPAAWTVMVYMAGNDLEAYAIEDFLEMATVGSTTDVNIVVQMDRTDAYDNRYDNWTDTRRGLLQANETPDLNWGTSIGEVNMGAAASLEDFVAWSVDNYQAENYALVLWGHGSGFSVCYDDLTADSLSSQEVSMALAQAAEPLDLVATDACLMGTLEFAYEIKNNASVFVASQEVEPGTGWNYAPILQDLVQTPAMDATKLGQSIVYHYGQYYNSPAGNAPHIEETMSAINLEALRETHSDSLAKAMSRFANTVMGQASAADLKRMDQHRDYWASMIGKTSFFGDRSNNYCDIGNLFSDIANDWLISPIIRFVATQVLTAYQTLVISNYAAVPGRHTGLSIYFQDWGAQPPTSYQSKLTFSADTTWDDFLQTWGMRPSLPPDWITQLPALPR